MHILFVLDYFPPYIWWIETLFDDVTNFWVKKWHTVYVITSRHDKKLPTIEKRNWVTIYRVGKNRFSVIFQALRFWLQNKSLLQSIDHIHTSTFSAAIPSWILSKFYKKKCTITIHEIYDRLRYHLKGKKGRWYVIFEKLLLRLPWAHIITVSKYTKSMIKDIYHLSDTAISVIYNQIDSKFWNMKHIQDQDIIDIKKEYNLTNKKIWLFVGRLGYEKWLPYLIESLYDIVSTHPNFVLVMIAPKTPHLYSEDIQSQIKSTKNQIINNNIHRHVIWIDPVKDDETLRLWMATSDIGIIPSMSEWFCYTAVQMQAMGLPLIVSKVGALTEVLSSTHTFIWYGKIKEISNAIIENLSLSLKKHIENTTDNIINYQEYYDLFEKHKK